MRVVDLFCGAGGFSEGFERAGFEIIRAYDIWEPAIITHNENHGFGTNPAQRRDIYEISILPDKEFEEAIPDSDVIIGSPPCVAFSNSNKSGKANKELGVRLIEAFLRIVARKQAKPNSILKYWVMENVLNTKKHLLQTYGAQELEWPNLGSFTLEIKNEGLYNMRDFGVPTNRKRYICGEFPNLNLIISDGKYLSIKRIIDAIGPPNMKNYKDSTALIEDPIYNFSIPIKELTDHFYIKEIPSFEWRKAKRQKQDKGYMGRMAFPENFDNPARTIMATMSSSSRESMIFPLDGFRGRYRYPTIREVATLMSFPIDFRFYGSSDSVKYRMVGNAVAPKFAYEIARVIREDFCKNHDTEMVDCFTMKKTFTNRPFTNLNGCIFEMKTEKEKRVNAKYSYHVPYLIKDAYRVGLNNNFDNGHVKWEVKVHHSQGKNAKVFDYISLPNELFVNKKPEINNFIKSYIDKIGNSDRLQQNYCMITEQRANLIGPDELLNAIKVFILEFEEEYLPVEDFPKLISNQILLSYYILREIVKGLELKVE